MARAPSRCGKAFTTGSCQSRLPRARTERGQPHGPKRHLRRQLTVTRADPERRPRPLPGPVPCTRLYAPKARSQSRRAPSSLFAAPRGRSKRNAGPNTDSRLRALESWARPHFDVGGGAPGPARPARLRLPQRSAPDRRALRARKRIAMAPAMPSVHPAARTHHSRPPRNRITPRIAASRPPGNNPQRRRDVVREARRRDATPASLPARGWSFHDGTRPDWPLPTFDRASSFPFAKRIRGSGSLAGT